MPAMPDWRDIGYLRSGSPRQRRAAQCLDGLGLPARFADLEATLVGTIPLGIDVPDSDLDIVCTAPDLDAFADRVRADFGDRPDLTAVRREVRSGPAVIARFAAAGERIELFAQARPVAMQDAYRHMVVEWRLLQLGGPDLRSRVIDLKRNGMKTEPAFAAALGLPGDPYLALLDRHERTDADLGAFISR